MAKGDRSDTVLGLAHVSMKPAVQPKVVVLELRNTARVTTKYAIGPEGLNALLAPALGLACQWADEPDLAIDTLTGPMNALPATAIAFRPVGPTELAVHVSMGKVDLVFLLPLDDAVR